MCGESSPIGSSVGYPVSSAILTIVPPLFAKLSVSDWRPKAHFSLKTLFPSSFLKACLLLGPPRQARYSSKGRDFTYGS